MAALLGSCSAFCISSRPVVLAAPLGTIPSARDLFRDLGYETIRRTMHKRLRAQ